MIRFLFWNTNNEKEIEGRLLELAAQFNVDVLMLAECWSIGTTIESLNRRETNYQLSSTQGESVAVFTRFPGNIWKRLGTSTDVRLDSLYCQALTR